MNSGILWQTGMLALGAGALFILAGKVLCRKLGVKVHGMRGKGEERPAALGLGIYGAFLIPFLYQVVIQASTASDRLYTPELQTSLTGVLILSSFVLLVWGWRCDRGRSGLETILVQWGAQATLWAVGVRINRMNLDFFGILPSSWGGSEVIELPLWISLVVTLLWFSLITSVIEFLDGIDGMASLIVGAGALAIGTHSWLAGSEEYLVPLYGFLLGGVALVAAWLGRPSGWFLMGKSGSFLLGFWFAVLTVLSRQKGAAASVLTPLILLSLVFAVLLFRFVERSLLGFGDVKQAGKRNSPAGGQ